MDAALHGEVQEDHLDQPVSEAGLGLHRLDPPGAGPDRGQDVPADAAGVGRRDALPVQVSAKRGAALIDEGTAAPHSSETQELVGFKAWLKLLPYQSSAAILSRCLRDFILRAKIFWTFLPAFLALTAFPANPGSFGAWPDSYF